MVKRFRFLTILGLFLFLTANLLSQEVVKTQDGRLVLLKPDGTWVYLEEKAPPGATSAPTPNPTQAVPTASFARAQEQMPKPGIGTVKIQCNTTPLRGTVQIYESPASLQTVGHAACGERLTFLGVSASNYKQIRTTEGIEGWIFDNWLSGMEQATPAANSVASPATPSGTDKKEVISAQHPGETDTGQKTATGKTIYEGPRGGHYHYSDSGKKVYERRK